MTNPLWTDVDRYIEARLAPSDRTLDAALDAANAAGLPAIAVSPAQGKLLTVLATAVNARRILEIGTLGGYSTLWLARALPRGGRIITLEYEPKHAEVARANFARAGLSDVIDMRVGAALDTLPVLARERDAHGELFDFVFIDADKVNTRAYYAWALRLVRPGALILVDNVVRDGKLADRRTDDANVRGMQEFMDALATDQRVVATTIQTVGAKGYDGFTLATVITG